ncbi:nuclear pore complex protein NUP1-like isoform X3 [Iris pallida]|uniref:Nuclear pore complex protein NUP1-like isoform X3 n=1 Tax=Iris pallida TaxID=29817 RepID=A0AAX6EU46_IRIPA|nr:nuclear pore complex protein NUP1-like isoform X3 [Iris pallida]
MSASPGNDQMNIEDNMTDITNQAPFFLAFGQPGNQPATPSLRLVLQLFSQVAHQSSSLVAIRIPLYLKTLPHFKQLEIQSSSRVEASLWTVAEVTSLV